MNLCWASTIVLLSVFLGYLSLDPQFIVHREGLVVITGASTGIGRSAAEALATQYPGLTVLAGVRREADAASIRASGLANLRPITLDVASGDSVSLAVNEIEAMNMAVVGLVNNAGVARGPTTLEFHEVDGDARSVFEVNVLGALRITQALMPMLRRSKGRVVFISSIFGALAPPMGGVYSASKFALEALADSLRREAGSMGLSVSVIRPGAVLTPIFSSLANSSIAAAVKASTLAARTYPHLHLPADIANEVRIEALAASTEVTDQAIVHALTNPRPRTRYTVANICGVPSFVLQTLAYILPDRWLDAVLAMKG